MSHRSSSQYGCPRDLFLGPISLVKFARLHLRIPPAKARGSIVRLSPLPVVTYGFLTHTEARQLVREIQVVLDLQHHLEINRVAMGQYPEHCLHDLVVFPPVHHVPKHLSSPLHLGLKDWDILKTRRGPLFPTTRARNRHLQFRMDRIFLGYPQQMEHLDCWLRPSAGQAPQGTREAHQGLRH